MRPMPAGLQKAQPLYISSVGLRVRGEALTAAGDLALDTAIKSLQQWGDLGFYMTANYTVSIDPVLVVQTTSERPIAAADQVDEARLDSTGATVTRKVSRVPFYILDDVTITYDVKPYKSEDLGKRTINLNYAMKANNATIETVRLGIPEPIARGLWDKPNETPPALGVAKVTINGRDMDPLLTESARPFTITRDFPVRYTFGSALLGEAAAGHTPLSAQQPAVFPSLAPAATPAPSTP